MHSSSTSANTRNERSRNIFSAGSPITSRTGRPCPFGGVCGSRRANAASTAEVPADRYSGCGDTGFIAHPVTPPATIHPTVPTSRTYQNAPPPPGRLRKLMTAVRVSVICVPTAYPSTSPNSGHTASAGSAVAPSQVSHQTAAPPISAAISACAHAITFSTANQRSASSPTSSGATMAPTEKVA